MNMQFGDVLSGEACRPRQPEALCNAKPASQKEKPREGTDLSGPWGAPTEADASISMSAIPTPTLHRTETKKAEADEAERGGFGNRNKVRIGREGDCRRPIRSGVVHEDDVAYGAAR